MLQNKFWQAFFAIAPLVMVFIILIAYFFFVFSMVSNAQEFEQSNEPPMALFANLGGFLIVILLAVLISLGSLIFYIVHAVQNPNLKENNLLIVWVLLFIFVGGIGKLIYWIVEIIGKRKLMSP